MSADAQTRALKLLKEISGFTEGPMRRAVLSDKLADIDDASELARILEAVIAVYRAEPTKFFVAGDFLADLRSFLDSRDYSVLQQMYETASEEGLENLKECMLAAKEERKGRAGDDVCGDPLLDSLTLGEKRALARTSDRDMIRRLLHVDSPLVAAALLENPHVTSADVVRMASKRPLSSEVLAVIGRHRRWIVNSQVRCAVVLNPSVPFDVAVGLLEKMGAGELRDVISLLPSGGRLSDMAKKLLSKRESETVKRRR